MTTSEHQHWRLTINRRTGRAAVELHQPGIPWRPWKFYGVVESEHRAQELIRAGWPDADGNPTLIPTICFSLEVIR